MTQDMVNRPYIRSLSPDDEAVISVYKTLDHYISALPQLGNLVILDSYLLYQAVYDSIKPSSIRRISEGYALTYKMWEDTVGQLLSLPKDFFTREGLVYLDDATGWDVVFKELNIHVTDLHQAYVTEGYDDIERVIDLTSTLSPQAQAVLKGE